MGERGPRWRLLFFVLVVIPSLCGCSPATAPEGSRGARPPADSDDTAGSVGDSAELDTGEEFPCDGPQLPTPAQPPRETRVIEGAGEVPSFGMLAEFGLGNPPTELYLTSAICTDDFVPRCSTPIAAYSVPDLSLLWSAYSAEEYVHLGHPSGSGGSAVVGFGDEAVIATVVGLPLETEREVRLLAGLTGETLAVIEAPDEDVSGSSWLDEDLVVGSRYQGRAEQGVIALFEAPHVGTRNFEDAAAVHHGLNAGDSLGVAIVDIGDVDGDGLSDLAFRAGWLYVASGADMRVDEGIGAGVPVMVDQPGNTRPAGDLDGDGVPDFTEQTIDINGEMIVQVVSGAGLQMVGRISDDRDDVSSMGGYAIGTMGDLDDNGYDSFLVTNVGRDGQDQWVEAWLIDGPVCGSHTYSSLGYLLPKFSEAADARASGPGMVFFLETVEHAELAIW